MLGDIDFTIDGKPLDFADTVTYRGMMFTGVPNMAWVFGYFRASWTLRADLVADFVCRLLTHMEPKGAQRSSRRAAARGRGHAAAAVDRPGELQPGYLMRGMHLLPKRGDREPWIFSQDYWREKDEIPAADLEDGTLLYQ